MAKGNGVVPRKPGRPSKLTPQRKDKILAAVRCGASFKTACGAAGIHESTFYRWQERGAEQDAPSEYREFCEDLTHAEEEGNAARVALIMRAAKTDWRAAAWLLERTNPDRWSMRYKIEHSGQREMTLVEVLTALRSDLPDQPAALEFDQ